MAAQICNLPTEDLGLVKGLVASVDCNVGALTEQGYRALAGPDSQVATVLTVLLTLYIAFIGLGMMMGRTPLRVGNLTIAAVKIGVVLALATSWPIYHQLVVDVLTKGPEELAMTLLGAVGAAKDPLGGLQFAYDQMQVGADYFVKQNPTALASPLTGGPAFGAMALNVASVGALVSTLGVLLAGKIVLTLLLALGPVFAGLLLFDATRGVFVGWLRAAIGAALAPAFGILSMVVYLVLVEGPLGQLARQRTQGVTDNGPAVAVLVITLIAACICAAGVMASVMIASGLKLPGRKAARDQQNEQPNQTQTAAPPLVEPARTVLSPSGEQPRVAALASAVASDRRDSRLRVIAGDAPAPSAPASSSPAQEAPGQVALGQSFRRTAQPRRAASSARRDR